MDVIARLERGRNNVRNAVTHLCHRHQNPEIQEDGMTGFISILRIPETGQTLFDFSSNLIQGTVIDRPNRFLVNVEVDGKQIPCHLHDPGRLKELIFPGNKVLIRKTNGIKTAYSVTASYDHGDWILTDTRIHSDIASKFLPLEVKREVKVGNHRIDFQWNSTLIEVKGCTLLREGIATFPDAPTKRGREHVNLLRRNTVTGGSSALMILVFRETADCFMPNSETDPDFSQEFYNALKDGVEVFIPRLSFRNGKIIYHGTIDIC